MMVKTIRQLTQTLMIRHADRLTALVETDGYNAQLCGHPVIADKSGFTIGSLVQACTMLYLHAKKVGASETAAYQKRMLRMFDLVAESGEIETWGKIGLLRSCRMLQLEQELGLLSEGQLAQVCEKTAYDDFIDYKTVTLTTRSATNYYYVAMACAGIREQLGFESRGASDRFMEKLLSIMESGSESGWMDEAPPHGRYDIYSVEMNLILLRELEELGKRVPEFLRRNVEHSARMMFDLRNTSGYGYSYGRSISMFGETKVVDYLAWAIENGVFAGEEAAQAFAFCVRCTERIVGFWYDDSRQLCNLWLDGRTTENYRGIHRIFEVNMSFVFGLFEIHKAFTRIGLADTLPESEIPEQESWTMTKTVFTKREQSVRAAYILHYGKHVFMLPLVGMGVYMGNAAYMPYPHEPHFLSAPPADERGKMPFLVPTAQMTDGSLAMPVQYYTNIREELTKNGITIVAEGRMAAFVDNGGWGTDSCRELPSGFEARYTFCGEKIRMEFNMEDAAQAKILYAGENLEHVAFLGAYRTEERDVSEDICFRTPYGQLMACLTAYYQGGSVVCEIKL